MTALPGVHNAQRHTACRNAAAGVLWPAADAFMGFVHRHQLIEISGRVLAGKWRAGGTVALGQGHCCLAVPGPLDNQPGDLRAVVAAGVPQGLQQSTPRSRLLR